MIYLSKIVQLRLIINYSCTHQHNQSPPNQKVTCSDHDISQQNCSIGVNQQLLMHSIFFTGCQECPLKIHCEYGFTVDADGCPTCTCKEEREFLYNVSQQNN